MRWYVTISTFETRFPFQTNIFLFSRLGSDPDTLFPFEMLMEHLHKFGKFGLILAAMLLPMITADPSFGVNLDEFADQVSDYKEGKVEMEMKDNPFLSENSKNKLHKRLRGVAIDMVRLGYV